VSGPSDVTAEMVRVLGAPARAASPIDVARALTRRLRARLAHAGDGRPASVRLVWQGRSRPPHILVRGLAGDSVAGLNLILRIVPDSSRGWRIRKVTLFWVCSRGVAARTDLCL
jgi:hypothetical protein